MAVAEGTRNRAERRILARLARCPIGRRPSQLCGAAERRRAARPEGPAARAMRHRNRAGSGRRLMGCGNPG